MIIEWLHPFTAIVAGPTSCGKSYFIKKFVSEIHKIIDTPIHEVVYCLPHNQPIDKEFTQYTISRGVPEIDNYTDLKPRLIILDDLMREADENIVDLFTKGSHHYNISVIFVTQNIFNQGKGRRDISLNAHYIVCFKNPRDRQQIQSLARQVYPDNTKYIQEAYKDATNTPHGYLLFDLKQSTPDLYRFRTKIFDTDSQNIVYIPRKPKS